MSTSGQPPRGASELLKVIQKQIDDIKAAAEANNGVVTAEDLKPLLSGVSVGASDGEGQKQDAKDAETTAESEGDQKENEPEVAAGSVAEVKNLYQKKDKDGKFQWVTEFPDDIGEAAENSETAKFAFIVRNKKSYDSRKSLEIDSIIVQSPLLKDSLGIVLKDYPGITTSLKRLVFRAPFQPFVHRWGKLDDLLRSMEDGDPKAHLKLLHDVLAEELKESISARNDLVANGVITFEHLWTILEPGALIYGTDEGKERLYELVSTSYGTDQRLGMEFINLYCWGVDWDGEKFGSSWDNLRNFEFVGTKPITRLAYFPLEFHPQKEELRQRLMMRGKLFELYAGYHFMEYKGPALTYGRCGLIKQTVDSRIIIDCEAHNRFLPNQAVYFSPLGKKKNNDSDDEFESQDTEMSDAAETDSSDFDSYSEVNVHTPSSNPAATQRRRPLTDRELSLAVPFVRGYALKNKHWFVLFLDQIVPIRFSGNAFSSLVLPEEQKRMILAFVTSQSLHKSSFDDVIEGKGRGMIMLLSGPPGVGKTLTAESVAEHMKVPLYMMSAGDLGTDPSGIENSLNVIMDMVAKWNAVLLLDVADVFLEARSTHDLERNKMVSIFLRVLEYYEGILFLTTNRIKNIDDAFHSRIHISMRYPDLTPASRRHIWQTFVGGKGGTGIGKAQLDKLATVDLNGRQIKNVVKTARMLARSEDGDGNVGMGHIETILAVESRKFG